MNNKITFEEMKKIVKQYIEQETVKGAEIRLHQMFHEILEEMD